MATKRKPKEKKKESICFKLRNEVSNWKKKTLLDHKRPLKQRFPLTEEMIINIKEFIDRGHVRAKSYFHPRNFKDIELKHKWPALLDKLEHQTVLIHPIWQYLMDELIGMKMDDQGLMDFKQKLMNKCILYGMADFKKNIKGRENEFREDVRRDKDIVALVRNMIEANKPNEFELYPNGQRPSQDRLDEDSQTPLPSAREEQQTPRESTVTKEIVTQTSPPKTPENLDIPLPKEPTVLENGAISRPISVEPLSPKTTREPPVYIHKNEPKLDTSITAISPDESNTPEESTRGDSASTVRSQATDVGCQSELKDVNVPLTTEREAAVTRPKMVNREITCDLDVEHTELNLEMSKRLHHFEITFRNIQSDMVDIQKRLRQLRWGNKDLGELDTTNKETLIEEATDKLKQIEQQIACAENNVSNETEKGTELDRLHEKVKHFKRELKQVKAEKQAIKLKLDEEEKARLAKIEELEQATKQHKEETSQYRDQINETFEQMRAMYTELKFYKGAEKRPESPE